MDFMVNEKLGVILKQRYEECDSAGHKHPDAKKNICNYCYRELRTKSYESEITEIMRRISPGIGPLDLCGVMIQRRNEAQSKREVEFTRGLELLEGELRDSGYLEGALKE